MADGAIRGASRQRRLRGVLATLGLVVGGSGVFIAPPVTATGDTANPPTIAGASAAARSDSASDVRIAASRMPAANGISRPWYEVLAGTGAAPTSTREIAAMPSFPNVTDSRAARTTAVVRASAPLPAAIDGEFDPDTSVEDIGERTEFTRTYRNSDGSNTLEVGSSPINYLDGTRWKPIDNQLVLGDDGVVRNAANEWTVEFGPLDSATPVEVTASEGSLGWSPVEVAAVDPVIEPDGVSVRYPDAWPGVDLVYRVSSTGIEEFVEIKEPGTISSFPFEFSGAPLTPTADGGVDLGGEWSDRAAVFSAPTLLDQSGIVNDALAQPELTVEAAPGPDRLELSVDEGWLDSVPADRFPVVVDPSLWLGRSRMESYKFNITNCARTATRTDLAFVGNPLMTSSSPERWHSVAHFDYSGILGTRVTDAVLWSEMWEGTLSYPINVYWAAAWGQHCGFEPVGGWGNLKGSFGTGSWWPESRSAPGLRDQYNEWTQNGNPGGALLFAGDNSYGRYTLKGFEPRVLLTYNSRPAAPTSGSTSGNGHGLVLNMSSSAGWDPDGDGLQYRFQVSRTSDNQLAADGGWQGSSSWSTTLPSWVYNSQVRWRVGVRDGLGQESWSGYLGSYTFTNAAPTAPTPVSPASAAVLNTTTPTLEASSRDADGDPFSLFYLVCKPLQTTGCVESGLVPGAWTVPAGRLEWAQPYVWYVTARDSHGATSSQVVGGSFFAAVPTTSPEWTLGINPFGVMAGQVDTSNGNLVEQSTDAAVSTVGPALAITRSYNSLDGRIGVFGKGWSSMLDMSLTEDARGVTVLLPDGRREFHGKNPNGTYVTFGYASSLTKLLNGFRYVSADRTRYDFGTTGALTAIVDPNGNMLRLDPRVGDQQTIVDVASGRSLTLTWSTPAGATSPHVAAVATDPVSAHGASLRWTYAYQQDLLVAVCEPTLATDAASNTCTTFGYDAAGRLGDLTRPKGNRSLSVTYDDAGKVATTRNGVDATWTFGYSTVTIDGSTFGRTTATDPRGATSTMDYDSLRKIVSVAQPDDIVGTSEYDDRGYLSEMTVERQRIVPPAVEPTVEYRATTVFVNDASGNVLSRTDEEGRTWRYTYNAERQVLTEQDPAGAVTTSVYDASGVNRITETRSATAQHPAPVQRWVYSDGSTPVDPVLGTGTVPRGLLIEFRDARNGITRYSYDARGDLRRQIDAAGAITTFRYDELGRRLATTEVIDGTAIDVETVTYDEQSRIVRLVGTTVVNVISGASHRADTSRAYDENDNLVTETIADAAGGDVSRTTHYEYDAADREVANVDTLGGRTDRTFDANGNVTSVRDPLGRVVTTTYDARNRVTRVQHEDAVDDPVAGSAPRDVVVLDDVEYDAADREIASTDAEGYTTRTTYDRTGRELVVQRSIEVAGPLTWQTIRSSTYDAAGRLATLNEHDGQRVSRFTYDVLGRTLTRERLSAPNAAGATAVDITESYVYDVGGNTIVERRIRAAHPGVVSETRRSFDVAGRQLTRTIENGANDLVETTGYDEWGSPISVTDAGGHRTDYGYDLLGRVIRATAPTMRSEQLDVTPTDVRPFTETGYDTFGSVTHERDPLGNVTTTSYDVAGRRASVVAPTYVAPGSATSITPTEQFEYDPVGNLVRSTDRRGATTTFVFDSRNRVVQIADPAATAGAIQGITRMRYDDLDNVVELVNQVGATIERSYDSFGRMVTETHLVTSNGAVQRLATTFEYDAAGNLLRTITPAGGGTTSTYSSSGEMLTSRDALGNTTTFGYDVDGRQQSVTDPLGRSVRTTFDQAGRAIQIDTIAPTGGAVIATVRSSYDAQGNRVSSTDANGVTTTYAYDTAHRIVRLSQPVRVGESIEQTFGYDAAGHLTRTTDGRGNTTHRTYNSWGLVESEIEPITPTDTSLAGRTWTTTYDAGGLPVRTLQPGGVTIARTFDRIGRVVQEVASGGGTTSVTKRVAYDLAGRAVSASHPAGSMILNYDERDLLVGVTGKAGTSSLRYDADGRLITRIDASGTAQYTWDDVGRLATMFEPITKTQMQFDWDPAGQLEQVRYGATDPTVRTYGWDDQGRMVDDLLVAPNGAVLWSAQYGHDANGNVTSEAIGPVGTPGAGDHQYTYDLAGRIASWTAPGTARVDYSWDAAGNRVRAGTTDFVYDARNRLVADSASTYRWTSRGTLAAVVNAAGKSTAYVADGFNRQIKAGTVSYTYDAFDRVAKRGTKVFAYSGLLQQPTNDGSTKISRTPDGSPMAVRQGTATWLFGQDRHGDVTTLFRANGTTANRTAYDPFGVPTARTGSVQNNVGYQGDWTDPTNGNVNMGARWYAPARAQFTARDTIQPQLTSPLGLNFYTYANANPISYFDPDGRSALWVSGASTYSGTLQVSTAVNYSGTLRVNNAATYTGTLRVSNAAPTGLTSAGSAQLLQPAAGGAAIQQGSVGVRLQGSNVPFSLQGGPAGAVQGSMYIGGGQPLAVTSPRATADFDGERAITSCGGCLLGPPDLSSGVTVLSQSTGAAADSNLQEAVGVALSAQEFRQGMSHGNPLDKVRPCGNGPANCTQAIRGGRSSLSSPGVVSSASLALGLWNLHSDVAVLSDPTKTAGDRFASGTAVVATGSATTSTVAMVLYGQSIVSAGTAGMFMAGGQLVGSFALGVGMGHMLMTSDQGAQWSANAGDWACRNITNCSGPLYYVGGTVAFGVAGLAGGLKAAGTGLVGGAQSAWRWLNGDSGTPYINTDPCATAGAVCY